jgi:hypothetical protein
MVEICLNALTNKYKLKIGSMRHVLKLSILKSKSTCCIIQILQIAVNVTI